MHKYVQEVPAILLLAGETFRTTRASTCKDDDFLLKVCTPKGTGRAIKDVQKYTSGGANSTGDNSVRERGHMDEPRVVAAIDFGTHGTGFAWCVVEEGNADPRTRQVNYCNQWDAQPVACAKNLSALLLDHQGDVLSWGFEARRNWITGRATAQHEGATYHAGFKMRLVPAGSGPKGDEGEGTAEEEDDSVALRAKEVRRIPNGGFAGDSVTPGLVTAYLRKIYRRALAQITASGYDEDDIRWCLTVPAIWSDYQKMVMRDAAKNAGMPTEDGRLLLALEPEAAAHHARVCGVQVASPDGETPTDLMTPGARFMVVDCGGGTVDITAYENDPSGRMIEIGRATGGKLGSDYLNRTFEEQLLVSRFGKSEILEDLRRHIPDALMDLTDAWERAKLHIRVDQSEPVYLNIPAAIDRRLGVTMRKRLARLQNGTSDAIVITPDEAKGLFGNVVPDILDLVEEQLAEMAKSRTVKSRRDAVLLVGGFSTSPYLQQAVRDHMGDRADVLVPPDPNIAVLFGAVHFCYEPHTRARRSRFTYGCDVCSEFREGVDPEENKLTTSEGTVLCRDRFSVFVRAGETVNTEAEVTHVYFPIEGDQKSVDFDLYATADSDPIYVTDSNCDKIGYFEVDLSRVMRFALSDRGVQLHMRFGETEVKARAVVMQTGEEVSATVRFHSNY
ncbi:Hsp70 family protein [Streptomyces sp. AP-93]|uniref:Hsp70 family protein n=1 Tax=Streptomyces sp. AP-93 TaxID=2929048 RepID=UPI001FAEB196|nr:Hsp70 family protein [Streptomyces sp. AP-93]MCJ0869166.1 HSP70 family protein [Streptomyces sp. AP-93]